MKDDFVFWDPYAPFDSNGASISFFDLFVAIARATIPCALWYGYNTLHSRAQIASFARRRFTEVEAQKYRLHGVNVFIKELRNNEVLFNPGIRAAEFLLRTYPCHQLKRFWRSAANWRKYIKTSNTRALTENSKRTSSILGHSMRWEPQEEIRAMFLIGQCKLGDRAPIA
jgi:hypothetical protein